MKVHAFLADSAEVVQGKIYALGIGWNTLFVGGFPVMHRRLAIGITAHVPFTATNIQHHLEVKLITQDGEDHPLRYRIDAEGKPIPIRAMGGEFTMGRPPMLHDGDEQVAAFAFNIDGVRFTEPGLFSWIISIDGAEVARLPMRVAQAQK